MNRKFKLAMAALLGFSAACSSVKQAPREEKPEKKPVDVEAYSNVERRVVVMYGVRIPDSIRNKRLERPGNLPADSLPPVTEVVTGEDPSTDTGR